MSWKSNHVTRRPIPVDLMEMHENVSLNGCVHHNVTDRDHDTMSHINVDATPKMRGRVTVTAIVLGNGR